MAQKLSWDEIKKQYPNEWVELADFDEDGDGYISNGFVIHHNSSKKKFIKETVELLKNKNYKLTAQLYTGEHKPMRNWDSIENEKSA